MSKSVGEQAREGASYAITYGTGTEGLKARATACQALAMVDLAEAIRFGAILRAMTNPGPASNMEEFDSMVADAKRLSSVKESEQ